MANNEIYKQFIAEFLQKNIPVSSMVGNHRCIIHPNFDFEGNELSYRRSSEGPTINVHVIC